MLTTRPAPGTVPRRQTPPSIWQHLDPILIVATLLIGIFGCLMVYTVTRDPLQAARWLKAAASKGQYQAQAVLGRLLFKGEPGVPRLIGNRRAYAQATLRHSVFGLVLGRLA